jgi:serine/threonine-protein kinase
MAPPVPNSPARTQRYLGRYELIGELARGGMGTVYLARHAGEAGFQRLFAIKVMHPHLAEETEFVDMLRDEARLAARIHHPNVVAIVDIGIQDDWHYVVMDYVEGPPFGTLIKRAGSEPNLERIINVVVDTLEGIHAAHSLTDDEGEELHLVHRDVSPQNILVGADGVARITDFGIAKAETRIASTRPGTRKGKLAFMAPEQITNDELIDKRADIWAAGVVLWTGLTGRNLFKGESDAATIHAVLSKEISPPSQVGRKPPEFLDEVVMRALERDQAKRYSSALEMADALRTAAVMNGLKCSRQQVAKWVGELFGEELGLRRKAIRAVARRREEQQELTEASQITVLPALPGVTGSLTAGGNTPVSNASTGPSMSHSLTPSGSVSGTDGKISGVQLGMLQAEPNPFASSRKRASVALGVLAVIGIGAVALAIGLNSQGQPSAEEPSAAAGAVPKAAPVAAAQPREAAPVKTSPEAASSAGAAAAEQPSSEDENTDEEEKAGATKSGSRKASSRSVRRTYSRVAAPKAPAAAPAEAPAAEPPSEPNEEPAGAKPRVPVPASTPAFEKNPYLRR